MRRRGEEEEERRGLLVESLERVEVPETFFKGSPLVKLIYPGARTTKESAGHGQEQTLRSRSEKGLEGGGPRRRKSSLKFII